MSKLNTTYTNTTKTHQVLANGRTVLKTGTAQECESFVNNFGDIHESPYGMIEVVAPGETVSHEWITGDDWKPQHDANWMDVFEAK